MQSHLVLGGASGIGAAVVRLLASDPDTLVVAADRDHEAAKRLAFELDASGSRVQARWVDVRDEDSVSALVKEFPNLDGLAVAAGIFRAAPSLETTVDDFHDLIAINLVGVYFAVQRFAAIMVERQRGSICVVVSIAATLPRLRQAAYCASKAGLRQALRVLAMETVPQGVRINMVSPGPTDTPMLRSLAADHKDVRELAAGSLASFRPRIPSGRVGRPEDVAEVVRFLLSPKSSHVAMQDLVVDGGELLGV